MVYFWAGLTVLLVIIEAVTVQLVTIWFAVGSLAALVAKLAGLNLTWQCGIFVAVSLLVLLLTRPFVKKITKKHLVPTNADRCIGKEAIVSETINNREGTGQVRISGITEQQSFGYEAEMILQKETHFRVVKVEKANGKIYVDMDVIGQG